MKQPIRIALVRAPATAVTTLPTPPALTCDFPLFHQGASRLHGARSLQQEPHASHAGAGVLCWARRLLSCLHVPSTVPSCWPRNRRWKHASEAWWRSSGSPTASSAGHKLNLSNDRPVHCLTAPHASATGIRLACGLMISCCGAATELQTARTIGSRTQKTARRVFAESNILSRERFHARNQRVHAYVQS